jgi:CheY-like chemotaxis protein
MSDEARTVLIVTDDPGFSGQVSELMLRAGVHTLCFAGTSDALQRARKLAPHLIMVHIPRDRMSAGWECYQLLQSDASIAAIPVLIYTPPQVLAERVVGAPYQPAPDDPLGFADLLAARLGPLIGAPLAWRRGERAAHEQALPTGRDDL